MTLYTQAKTRKSYLFLSQQHGINGKSCQEDDNYYYLLSSFNCNTSCDPLKKQINPPSVIHRAVYSFYTFCNLLFWFWLPNICYSDALGSNSTRDENTICQV